MEYVAIVQTSTDAGFQMMCTRQGLEVQLSKFFGDDPDSIDFQFQLVMVDSYVGPVKEFTIERFTKRKKNSTYGQGLYYIEKLDVYLETISDVAENIWNVMTE
jgi:hypothetical protein